MKVLRDRADDRLTIVGTWAIAPTVMRALKAVALLALVGLLSWGVWAFVQHQADVRAHGDRFQGACEVMGGQVHDDLCIRDDRVVLRESQVK